MVLSRGSARSRTFAFRDFGGTPIDLTAYGARAMIRADYDDLEPTVSLTIGAGLTIAEDPVTGTMSAIRVDITSAQATIVANGGVGLLRWSLWLDPNGTPDGASWEAIKGPVLVEETSTWA